MTASQLVTITVAIASVGRPDALERSIRHIRNQSDTPDALIVVAQATDAATQDVAQSLGAGLVIVPRPGLALALQTAISVARTDVIAFVDDDAEALPNWVSSIRKAFSSEPHLGLLGGRDNVDADRSSGSPTLVVGFLRRGKIIGNHHLGLGRARPVQHVKGANMSMLVQPAKRIPLELLVSGTGAQARNEFILSLGIVSQGFKALYDPSIQVDHFPAKRAAGDERTKFNKERTRIVRDNETVAMYLYRSKSELYAYVLRTILIGDHTCYGLAYLVYMSLKGDKNAWARTMGSFSGLAAGLKRGRAMRGRKVATLE